MPITAYSLSPNITVALVSSLLRPPIFTRLWAFLGRTREHPFEFWVMGFQEAEKRPQLGDRKGPPQNEKLNREKKTHKTQSEKAYK